MVARRGEFRRKLSRFASDGHARTMAPWFAIARDASDVGRMRHFALRAERPDWTRLERAVHLAGWLLALPPLSLAAVARSGGAAQADGGSNRLAQWVQLLLLAIRQNVPPHAFYRYRLYRAKERASAPRIIQLHELATLLPWLNNRAGFDQIDDKAAFTRRMDEAGLPVAVTLAEVSREEVATRRAIEDWPCEDLVLKPTRQFGGSGVQVLRAVPEGHGWLVAGQPSGATDLLRWAQAQAGNGRMLLQVRLRNAASLAPLADQGTSTIRVVTHLDDEQVTPLVAVFRLPAAGAFVDNFKPGAMIAPIDLATGRLGPAVANDRTAIRLRAHPRTGAPIDGQLVPHWPALLDLVVRAHRVVGSPPAFLGWDVLVTDDGPRLIEANSSWSADVWQVATGQALGDTDFPARYQRELQRAGRELPS